MLYELEALYVVSNRHFEMCPLYGYQIANYNQSLHVIFAGIDWCSEIYLLFFLYRNVSISRRFPRNIPDCKVHGANMGPIWGRQDPRGPHIGPMNFVIWASMNHTITRGQDVHSKDRELQSPQSASVFPLKDAV